MEKKTMGGFIAALRKANGMTQKDLADRLNVSDKTISRWERDDGYPDLSVIPVIAEIFGVTCDELLRGERKSPEKQAEFGRQDELTAKGEKQRQHLLAMSLSQYKSRTYIAVGISILGLIVAAIFNIGFLRSFLGFLFGSIFYAASLICQAIFWNNVSFGVSDGNFADSKVNDWKRAAIKITKRSVGITVLLFGFTVPLLLGDTYSGIVESWPLFGAVGAVAFLLLYTVICWFIDAVHIKKGVYTLTEKESAIYHHNNKLKKICAVVLTGTLLVTFVIHQALTSIWGPLSIMDGTTFEDYESFIDYMEQDIKITSYGNDNDTVTQAIPSDSEIWYDEYGNEITEDEVRYRALQDKNGKIVCEYIGRNENVVSISYTPKDGTILPITVFTQDELNSARQTVAVRNAIFYVVYFSEAALVVMFYFIKRAR